jgi:hypothetical protein
MEKMAKNCNRIASSMWCIICKDYYIIIGSYSQAGKKAIQNGTIGVKSRNASNKFPLHYLFSN